jgi:glycosyltransferase involved in cell wall biosynthesis
MAALPQAPGRAARCLADGSAEMLTRAGELGVIDRVRVAPFTDQIEQYYAAADVFVFPTPYDAFGMVISEAMRAGCRSSPLPRPGAAEIIEPGRTGLIVQDPADVAALAAHLQGLAADPAHGPGSATRPPRP